MDLTGWLLRLAARRPHVLVVAVPGETGVRVAVEAEAGRRGWPVASSPADADLLVVAGVAGPRLTDVVETVWAQLPAPRVRISVTQDTDLARGLDAGQRELADAARPRRAPVGGEVTVEPVDAHVIPGGEHRSMDHDVHQGHGGMVGMEMPGGVPMADLGEDRDGLQLDALHVPLGPVLLDWPAGLVLRVVLQGDVIVAADAEVLDGGAGPSFWAQPLRRAEAGEPVTVGDVARRAAAGHLDALARFLGVAGWSDPALRARRLRDALLAGEPADAITAPARDLVVRVARSRTLRWHLRGVSAGRRDLSARLADRLAALRAALELLDDTRPAAAADLQGLAVEGAAIAPDELAAALVGAEFAAARLVVAALGPDLCAPAREVPPHGPR